jgi:hypothetical protein
MNESFSNEFKYYLKEKGINIDWNIFDLKFNPPQNFAAYRQSEMDSARVATFGSVVGVPFISKRFALKRFLGLTAEEVTENEKLWSEENQDTDDALPSSAELRSAGITGNSIAGDMSALGDNEPPPELGPEGSEGGIPAGGAPGGAPGGATPGSPAPGGTSPIGGMK